MISILRRFAFLILLILACGSYCERNLRAELISALGDSNTAGGSDAYPGLLKTTLDQRYGAGRFQVVNHGISGQTTGDLLSNLNSTAWLDENPDIVLLMIGGNDLWPLLSSPSVANFLTVVQETADRIQQAVEVIRTHDYPGGSPPTIIVSAYVPNKLPNVTFAGFSINPNIAVETLNSLLASDLTGADVYFANNYDDALDPATQKARASLMRDNLHLNQAGRQMVADNFADVIYAVVPEPGTIILAALGLLALVPAGIRRRSAR